MKTISRLQVSAVVALLSVPFWFVCGRFRLQLGRGRSTPSTGNLETPEALAWAAGFALITFAVGFFWSRGRPRKP